MALTFASLEPSPSKQGFAYGVALGVTLTLSAALALV